MLEELFNSLLSCFDAADDESPEEIGENYGGQIKSEGQALAVVRRVLQEMPSTLAYSFLEGFLQTWSTEQVRQEIVSSISIGCEITSAAVVVGLLRDVFKTHDAKIFQEIVAPLATTLDVDAQERYCFAIWTLVCGEVYDLQLNELRSGTKSVTSDQIERILNRHDLNHYCKQTLTQARMKLLEDESRSGGE